MASRGSLDKHGLCLLSLDGGGVRGLSTLLILQGLMRKINAQRQQEGFSQVKPCEMFDLIGGTSTGGLIAIMLGHLQMDTQDCIRAYSGLSRDIFSKKCLPVNWRGEVTGRYKSSELVKAVKKIIREANFPGGEGALLNDCKDRGCRVFVCAVRKENKEVARLRNYQSDRALVEDRATIWEAARATSAASSFFDPITIGKHGQEYVDAGLGCNNPIDQVWTEAQDIWSSGEDDLGSLIKCFISIGTGDPGTSPINDGVFKMIKVLKEIAAETEMTARSFEMKHRGLLSQKRYFRFNVDQGLQNVGLDEYEKEKEIVSATSRYMESQQMMVQSQACAHAMKNKEFWSDDKRKLIHRILRERQLKPEKFRVTFSLSAAPEIAYFVGRESYLSTIEAKLPITAVGRQILVLYGLGGIGKSQLAIEYAKGHRDDYSAVLWLNAKTEETLKQSFANNAWRLSQVHFDQELLHRPQDKATLTKITREMMKWLSLPGNDQWLIIYDNMDNPKLPDNKATDSYDIRLYFPEAHQGSIIITTRWQTLDIGTSHKVVKLSRTNSDEESISLLEKQSDRKGIREDAGIQDLLDSLDGLPLALATAGACLRETSMPISEYLGHYKTSWRDIQEDSPQLTSYDQTLYSTWNMSYRHILKEDEAAAKLLELCAYLDNQDIWFGLLESGRDEDSPDWFLKIIRNKWTFIIAMAKLQKHALTERLTESDGYSIHNCVHSWIKTVLWTGIEKQKLKLACLCSRRTVPAVPAPGDWKTRQRLLPHAQRCLEVLNAERNDTKDIDLEYYVHDLIHNLGVLYYYQGKLEEAESLYQRALIARQKALGPYHTDTLGSSNNLGLLYGDQGKLEQAELIYQRAIDGVEKAFRPDNISILAAFNNLGIVYSAQGKLDKAELMYLRALNGYEKSTGLDYISATNTVYNLGILYHGQGKLERAESMSQRALDGYEKTLGPDHIFTLSMVSDLGCLYAELGKLEQAESMLQQALNVYNKKGLEQDDLGKSKTLYVLGTVYHDQGKLENALVHFTQAYEGFLRMQGPQSFWTLGISARIEDVREDIAARANSGKVNDQRTTRYVWQQLGFLPTRLKRRLEGYKEESAEKQGRWRYWIEDWLTKGGKSLPAWRNQPRSLVTTSSEFGSGRVVSWELHPNTRTQKL